MNTTERTVLINPGRCAGPAVCCNQPLIASRFSDMECSGGGTVVMAVSNDMKRMDAQVVPELQAVTLPSGHLPPHRALFKRRAQISRGAAHHIAEAATSIAPGIGSGLQAMLTPTLATHVGGTTISHIGTSTAGPRIVIPLPAALATATAITTGAIVPTPVAGASGTAAAPAAPLPSMAIDGEWFFPQAYPLEIRQYLTTSYSFDLQPTPGDVVEKTQTLLRNAYTNLKNIGLDIKIAPAMKEILDEVTSSIPGSDLPKHPFAESEATKTLYLILAYVVSTLLWTNGASKPLRDYKEVTYPGVIVASYVVRMTSYYLDLSRTMRLTNPPYLISGGRENSTDTSVLTHHGETGLLSSIASRKPAIVNIPVNAVSLRIAAEFATGRKTATFECTNASYAALQDAALNVQGLTPDVVKNFVELKKPPKENPLKQQIIDARCGYYLGLIRGTIKPGDNTAGIPGGDPGIEPLTTDGVV